MESPIVLDVIGLLRMRTAIVRDGIAFDRGGTPERRSGCGSGRTPGASRVLLVALLAFAFAFQPARAHPQDGAHADVRIAIDDRGVRMDVVMNLVFLDGIIEFVREDPGAVHALEESGARDALLAYFTDENEVDIDGTPVEPVGEKFEVVRPGLELLPLFPKTGMRGLQRVRLLLRYPSDGHPESVQLFWATFPPDLLAEPDDSGQLPPLTLEAQLDAEGAFKLVRLTESEPGYTWHTSGTTAEERFLQVPEAGDRAGGFAVPIVSCGLIGALGVMLVTVGVSGGWAGRKRLLAFAVPVLLIGAGLTLNVGVVRLGGGGPLPSEDEAESIFRPLHSNIYRAFDYSEESAVYDALARSVDGPLLDDLYNEIYRSLILYEEGGAVARVTDVEQLSTDVSAIGLLGDGGTPGFTVDARWRVTGVVYHWGHSHTRINEYRAEYSLALLDGGWRITGSRLIEQERVDDDGQAPELPIGEL